MRRPRLVPQALRPSVPGLDEAALGAHPLQGPYAPQGSDRAPKGSPRRRFLAATGKVRWAQHYVRHGLTLPQRCEAYKRSSRSASSSTTAFSTIAPWYHVLVHEATHQTYVAERNLEPDAVSEPIDHPLVPQYFEVFRDGTYLPRQRSN